MFGLPERIIFYVTEDKIAQAEKWYSDILGRAPLFSSNQMASFSINGIYLILEVPEEITNSCLFQPEYRYNTKVHWNVESLENVAEKLTNKGALQVSEIISNQMYKTGTFKDPFGNIFGLTEKVSGKGNSIISGPSETAQRVAFNRALASASLTEPKGKDYLAEIFLPEDLQKIVRDNQEAEKYLNQPFFVKQYGFFLARTNYIEQIFEEALSGNIPQIVFLGAGYDTRSIRFSERIKDTMIYELDAPTTQQNKLKIFEMENIVIPYHVNFVSINFVFENIGDVLKKAGYLENKKTLFIWEGVTYYLTEEAINKTLDFVKENSSVGTCLVFDYQITEVPSISTGEPFLFWKTIPEINAKLETKGFRIVESLDPKAMEEKLLTQNGKQVYHVMPYFAFCHSEIIQG